MSSIPQSLATKISSCLDQFGEKKVLEKLAELESTAGASNSITIITNAGSHPLPTEMLQGEVFIASRGQFNFSDIESARQEYEAVLAGVAARLKEKRWNRVLILPFGPATLSMQIKLLVQKTLGIESIEILHLGGGKYGLLEINQRPLIVASP